MAQIEFVEEDGGYFPLIRAGEAGQSVRVSYPVIARYLNGPTLKLRYSGAIPTGEQAWTASAEWSQDGWAFAVSDRWSAEEDGVVVERRFEARREAHASHDESGPARMQAEPNAPLGVQLQLEAALSAPADSQWRFFAPATRYTEAGALSDVREAHVYMEDRLTYPLVAAYCPAERSYVALGRLSLAATSEAPRRTAAKETRYLQKTEVGSVGYSAAADEDGSALLLQAYWPYYEGDSSVALNARREPVSAYYPLEEAAASMKLSYGLRFGEAGTFADAAYGVFSRHADIHPPQPVDLPFSLADSIEYRSVSLRRSYRELAGGGAGFFFHFDPRHGYSSQPSGFGTSFNNIPHETYTRILEYGFTGRQINTAYSLALSEGGEWIEKGRKVTQFFVDRMTMPSGFLYSLYDIEREKPFASFGEEGAPKLHYISHGNKPGNYLRTMVEPAFDLLTIAQVYNSLGSPQPSWMAATMRFADFLLERQNPDGSWYRAFEPDGTPLTRGEGFGSDEFSAKSATSIPILYLIAVSEQAGAEGAPYSEAARKAGDFVLDTYVARDHYMGGTLDNPNVVDKEASQYTMAALYGLYKLTGDSRYLQGAVRAGRIFATWNYIWNAPCLPGTDLDKLDFKTVGTGGINSIWGGGAVDIYSLFHIKELDALGAEAGEPFFRSMARWIAIGTQQVLSHPGDLMGFADIGMQPEGFGVCNQGFDEGMIAKGAIWGTLGWIYSAGIYGLERYLASAPNQPNQ